MNRKDLVWGRAVACGALASIVILGCSPSGKQAPEPSAKPQAFAQPPPGEPPPGDSAGHPITPTSATETAGKGKGEAVRWRTAGKAKPISAKVSGGLDWLAKQQLETGGWGQGDEAAGMGGGQTMRDVANVADTSMAVLALIRSGSSASKGEYRRNIHAGLLYMISEIEESDRDSLYVTDVRGTRVQSKIGTYVDTFTALMVLSEAEGTMPSPRENRRLKAALTKILAKVERNQKTDGTWANQGWAPVLTQSLAAKGLNRVAQSGYDVDEDVLDRVEQQAQQVAKTGAGGSYAAADSAGIDLYAGAASNSVLRDSMNTRKSKAKSLRQQARRGDEAERKAAEAKLRESRDAEVAAEGAEEVLLRRLEEPSFVKGFGNNGGEEFLSYLLISETLVAKGGDEWSRWDSAITKLIGGVQNADGSWTGHHCITGRTFCTAAALLVLMADRTPIPEDAQVAL